MKSVSDNRNNKLIASNATPWEERVYDVLRVMLNPLTAYGTPLLSLAIFLFVLPETAQTALFPQVSKFHSFLEQSANMLSHSHVDIFISSALVMFLFKRNLSVTGVSPSTFTGDVINSAVLGICSLILAKAVLNASTEVWQFANIYAPNGNPEFIHTYRVSTGCALLYLAAPFVLRNYPKESPLSDRGISTLVTLMTAACWVIYLSAQLCYVSHKIAQQDIAAREALLVTDMGDPEFNNASNYLEHFFLEQGQNASASINDFELLKKIEADNIRQISDTTIQIEGLSTGDVFVCDFKEDGNIAVSSGGFSKSYDVLPVSTRALAARACKIFAPFGS